MRGLLFSSKYFFKMLQNNTKNINENARCIFEHFVNFENLGLSKCSFLTLYIMRRFLFSNKNFNKNGCEITKIFPCTYGKDKQLLSNKFYLRSDFYEKIKLYKL